MKARFSSSFVVVALLIVLGLWRLLSMHFDIGAAYTPMGAIALFCGAYFHKQRSKGYSLAVGILLVSDLLLMHAFYSSYQSGFLYKGWMPNYVAFLGMIYLGKRLLRNARWFQIPLTAALAALFFYIVSNAFVWMGMGGGFNILTAAPYTRDLNGLWACYVNALPFLKNMLIGNIAYSALLFGAAELSRYYQAQLKTITERLYRRKP